MCPLFIYCQSQSNMGWWGHFLVEKHNFFWLLPGALMSGTVEVLSGNALTLHFHFSPLQSRGVFQKARKHTVHQITHSWGPWTAGASEASLCHVHRGNKLSRPADGDFSAPVRVADHKQHIDVSFYLSVELWRVSHLKGLSDSFLQTRLKN